MTIRGKRVFVGLSGGVDSSVSAALLQQAGASVVGVFIKGWYPPGLPCTWADDRRDAMRIAARLGIPFYTLDAAVEYKKNIIDYLIAEYAIGRTPNPDVFCNRDIKFGVFAYDAFSHGADYIATGHYVRVFHSIKKGNILSRGVDSDKDQSYFLWAVSPKVLSRVLFPIGKYKKPYVRELAEKFHIPVAKKKDSQGICFLGPVSVEEFLRSEFGTTVGPAVDIDGKDVGTHDGAVLYTIGERIALANADNGPWYVVAKHIKNNKLIVSRGKSIPLYNYNKFLLQQTNWFTDPFLADTAQYRYHGNRIKGNVTLKNNTYIFTAVNTLPEIPAEGQSLVLYKGTRCIGGGILNLCK